MRNIPKIFKAECDIFYDLAEELDREPDSLNRHTIDMARDILLEIKPDATQKEIEVFLFHAGFSLRHTKQQIYEESTAWDNANQMKKVTGSEAREAVARCDGNKSEAARELKISLSTLKRRLNDEDDPPWDGMVEVDK